MGIAELDLVGNVDSLKVSATDVANHGGCPRNLAVKTRPSLQSRAWRRSFGSEKTFVLGIVLDMVKLAHQAPQLEEPDADVDAWITSVLDSRKVHRLLRPYVATGVTNVLDAHWDIEDDVGPLTFLNPSPEVGEPPRVLTAWAPMYIGESGYREIRRYRVGAAHSEPIDNDHLWVDTAAYVAAEARGPADTNRIRVVEIGLSDASISVMFDGTPDEAKQAFASVARGVAGNLGDPAVAIPGNDCSNCQVAGVCDALIPVSDVLGQTESGYASRSVSPSDLDTYQRCAARWLLAKDLHLPREGDSSEAQNRGLAVHLWLEHAHRREVGCEIDDLPDPAVSMGIAAEVMTADQYATAYPFLRHHVQTCPLSVDGAEVEMVEQSIHGFDASAQVVAVTKPDLGYRLGERLIVREFKTVASLQEQSADEVFAKFFQAPFLIAMLAAGVLASRGLTDATVELELLAPDRSEVFVWDLEDEEIVARARSTVAEAAAAWHHDSTWAPTPSAQCAWCEVRQWCPDRDAYLELSPAPPVDPDNEPAPF